MGYNQEQRRLKAIKENTRNLETQGGVSLIHPFYNDEKRMALHYDIWEKWSERVCKNVNITLIDDGSPTPLVIPEDKKALFIQKGVKITVYRILKDLKWNTPGALNLGVLMAPNPWVLFMDSDCFFDSENWEKILDYSPDIHRITKFPRKRYGDSAKEDIRTTRYLPCAMLMHRNVFTKIGGFDEDFTGENSKGYGFFDNEFDGRAIKLEAYSTKYCVATHIVAGEWMPSCYKGSIVQRSHHHQNTNKHLMYKKENGEVPQNRKILNFPWQQVYSNW